MTITMKYINYLFALILLMVVPGLSAAQEPSVPHPAAQPTPAQPIPAPPQTAARAFVLLDFHTGRVLAESNADERMEPASLTKLMTAYIAFRELAAGNIAMDDKVTISEQAWRTMGSRTFVQVGTQVSVEDLIKGMIIQSGNDASVALAEHIAGSESGFAAMMNREAKRLGMNNSRFMNSTGMPDPDLYITAHDVGRLTRALIRDFPDHYQFYSTREFTYNEITQYNRNKLLWQGQDVDGVKTGYTESAGYCLVASALRDGMRLITVVLGTSSESARAKESQGLLNYGFRFFETHRLYEQNKPISTVRIWKGDSETLPLGLDRDLYITVARGQYDDLNAAMEIDTAIMAPARKGQPLGKVKVTLDQKVIAERSLVALEGVAEGSLWQRLSDSAKLWFN